MLTKFFLSHISEILKECTGDDMVITGTRPLGGGSINDAVCVTSSAGDFFMKYNQAKQYPGMFESENRGLELLRAEKTIGIPGIITTGEFENVSFIILEMLHPGKRIKNYDATLGHELAMLHQRNADSFGLDHNNYIGSLPQSNTLTLPGSKFMIEHRFRPLVEMAIKKNLISTKEAARFDTLYKRLPELLPGEKPSLLHGDLWSGNVITGPDGKAWLIDPAVYYGYREIDIAMTKLFGGFNEEFYTAYNETYPLPAGWEERVGLFQLYPLLVHVNLFGRGYWRGVGDILERYDLS